MATANGTSTHQELCMKDIASSVKPMEFDRYYWGDLYRGTISQLLETGKFVPEWFPGMDGNKPTSHTLRGIEFEGRIISSLQIARKDRTRRRFTAWVRVNEAEQEQRLFERDSPEPRAKSMERAISWLRSMPKSKAEFVALNIFSIKEQMAMQVNWMKSNAGYSFSDNSMAKLHAALDAMVSDVKGCEINYSAEDHEASRRRSADDAFENQGFGRYLNTWEFASIDRKAEKEKFIAEALAITVDGHMSEAISKYL